MSVRTPDPDPTPDPLDGSGARPGPAWLSDIELEQIRRRLPLLYVEAVPVRVDGLGQVTEVGVLLRANAVGEITRTACAGHPSTDCADARNGVVAPTADAPRPVMTSRLLGIADPPDARWRLMRCAAGQRMHDAATEDQAERNIGRALGRNA